MMSSATEDRLASAAQALADGKNETVLHEAEVALAELEQQDTGAGLRAQAYELACKAAMNLAVYSKASEYAHHALELLAGMDEPKRMHSCRLDLAVCSLHQGNLRQAHYLVIDVGEEAERHSWPDLQARCQLLLGTLAWQEGRIEEGIVVLEQALPMLEKQKLTDYAIQAHSSLGVALAMAACYDEAEKHCKTALDYFRQRGNAIAAVRCLNNLAGLAFKRQDWNRAREYLLDCVKFMAESGNKMDLATAWQNLGLVEMYAGDWRLAKKYLNRGLQLAQEVENRQVEADALLKLSILSLAKGDPAEAANYGELSRNRFEGLTGAAAPTLNWFLALIQLANGRDEAAQLLWAERAPWPIGQNRDFLKELLQRVLADQYADAIDLPESSRELGRRWLLELDEMIAG